MSDDPVVQVEGVSKKFCRRLRHSLVYGMQDFAREMIGRSHQGTALRPNEFWALRDLSFSVRRGETLALIGRNGAGKSTTLKMLNGLLRPDTGRITVRGRVQAMLELGAGFSPVLSARENVYINAAMLGMPRADIDNALPEIMEFAGLEDVLETPLQNFSSGMRARLAFAVATQLDPDVLLLDEVLAVGDLAFQEKCMRRMEAFRRRNKAVIFITHNLYQVEAMCNSAVWLEEGQVVAYGRSIDVVREYLDMQERRTIAEAKAEGGGYQPRAAAAERAYLRVREEERAKEVVEPASADPFQVRAVEILDREGQPCEELPFRSDLIVRIHYETLNPVLRPLFELTFVNDNREIFQATMLMDGLGPDQIQGKGVVECRIDRLPLTPKVYGIKLAAFQSGNALTEVATRRTIASFRVTDEGVDSVSMRGPLALTILRQGPPVYVPRVWHFYDGQGSEPVAIVEAYFTDEKSNGARSINGERHLPAAVAPDLLERRRS
jgi:ABC-type polysaccharide/polyol phosphate transport system ATPase subunit